MSTKRQKTTRNPVEMDIPRWKIEYILTGREPESVEIDNRFTAFVFMETLPGSPVIRWGKERLPWFLLYHKIKETPVIKNYENEYGLCFAARRYYDYITEHPCYKEEAEKQIKELL
jgi:hypothetical protein